MNILCLSLVPLALFSTATPVVVRDEPPNWSKGALIGRVLDSVTGQPLPSATVALQDKDGKVLAWTKTDAKGEYTLAADSLSALQLRPSRRRGMLEKLARGAGQVVAAPVKAVAGVAKQVDPVKTVKAAVVSSATGNPLPLATQALGTASKSLKDQTTTVAKTTVAKTVLGERTATPKEKRPVLVPGEVFLSVAAPGFKELKEKTGAYWLEAPTPASADGKTPQIGVRAWLETVKLAPAALADKKSAVENSAILLADGKAEPTLAVAGTPVRLSVKLNTPGNSAFKVRVFAREDKKRTIVELKPIEATPGVFAGELPLDAELGVGDTIITLVALRAEPIEVKLSDKKSDPLLEFARNLDDLDPDKAYEFDLRIMASENRLELPLTILDPKKASPTKPQ